LKGMFPRCCFYIFILSSVSRSSISYFLLDDFSMRFAPLFLSAAGTTLAARPFLNEPDTGIDDVLGSYASSKSLPPLSSIVALPDFDWAACQVMNASSYAYYRNGAGGEWSYRSNLESYSRFRLRPRTLVDITGIESTLKYELSPPMVG
jgi:FMN-dependent dehydrogenase